MLVSERVRPLADCIDHSLIRASGLDDLINSKLAEIGIRLNQELPSLLPIIISSQSEGEYLADQVNLKIYSKVEDEPIELTFEVKALNDLQKLTFEQILKSNPIDLSSKTFLRPQDQFSISRELNNHLLQFYDFYQMQRVLICETYNNPILQKTQHDLLDLKVKSYLIDLFIAHGLDRQAKELIIDSLKVKLKRPQVDERTYQQAVFPMLNIALKQGWFELGGELISALKQNQASKPSDIVTSLDICKLAAPAVMHLIEFGPNKLLDAVRVDLLSTPEFIEILALTLQNLKSNNLDTLVIEMLHQQNTLNFSFKACDILYSAAINYFIETDRPEVAEEILSWREERPVSDLREQTSILSCYYKKLNSNPNDPNLIQAVGRIQEKIRHNFIDHYEVELALAVELLDQELPFAQDFVNEITNAIFKEKFKDVRLLRYALRDLNLGDLISSKTKLSVLKSTAVYSDQNSFTSKVDLEFLTIFLKGTAELAKTLQLNIPDCEGISNSIVRIISNNPSLLKTKDTLITLISVFAQTPFKTVQDYLNKKLEEIPALDEASYYLERARIAAQLNQVEDLAYYLQHASLSILEIDQGADVEQRRDALFRAGEVFNFAVSQQNLEIGHKMLAMIIKATQDLTESEVKTLGIGKQGERNTKANLNAQVLNKIFALRGVYPNFEV